MGNNNVILVGVINSEIVLSHSLLGANFFATSILVERASGNRDIIPVVMTGSLLNPEETYVGKFVKVIGQFRSYDKYEGDKRHLLLCVYAQKIDMVAPNYDCESNNRISLCGYLCKKAVFRKTPLGREIADMIVSVNRPYMRADYIPCITWGISARYAETLKIGTQLKVYGRIQSREYTKKIDEIVSEKRIAYEVSISRLEVLESEEDDD